MAGEQSYTTPREHYRWGTYRQWQEKDCQVRGGEKSSLVIFYKSYEVEAVNEQTGETEAAGHLVARASRVFNATQVDGFATVAEELPDTPTFDPPYGDCVQPPTGQRIERAERFAAATGAEIEETGDRACFIPPLDTIRMPERRRLTGTDTRQGLLLDALPRTGA